MVIMDTWVFRDNWHASIEDWNLLCTFLQQHQIPVEGHFRDALDEDSGAAWKYPAFAVKHCSSNSVLIKKLRLLCQDRGKDKNDVERNYDNQLVEFVALYHFVALMGYRFDGWEKSSGKTGVNPQKNCDLVFVKDGQQFFADAKDENSEKLSQSEEPGHPGWSSFNPKYEPEQWLKRMIKDAGEKGADFLVCRIPKWRLRGFDESCLKEWLPSVFKNILILPNQCPRWPIQSESVSRVVIVDPRGCFTIQIDE